MSNAPLTIGSSARDKRDFASRFQAVAIIQSTVAGRAITPRIVGKFMRRYFRVESFWSLPYSMRDEALHVVDELILRRMIIGNPKRKRALRKPQAAHLSS